MQVSVLPLNSFRIWFRLVNLPLFLRNDDDIGVLLRDYYQSLLYGYEKINLYHQKAIASKPCFLSPNVCRLLLT